MKRFEKIAIIGVGLLGGSIGLAVKKKKLAREVVGFFRDKKKGTSAVKRGIVDRAETDFQKCVKSSDFIILCSPVADIVKKLSLIKKSGKRDALIADIGSTKREIARAAAGLNFIGAHPLAGSEQSGAAFARADLFLGCLTILTPADNAAESSVRRVKEFWNALGSEAILMSPQAHDTALALTSHLPHAIAFSLIKAIPAQTFRFSAGGLRDTTRIALSDPHLWLDIFESNKHEILRALAAFEKSLKGFKSALACRDRKKLLTFLKAAQNARMKLPPKL